MPELTWRLVEIGPAPKPVEPLSGPIPVWIDKATGQPPVPGDILYAVHLFEPQYREMLSEKYWARSKPRRLPIIVVLPTAGGSLTWHCVD